MAPRGPSVIVIGAGIIGAAAAQALQAGGARVTIVDAGSASATEASFGWINASFFENDAHFRLRAEGLAAWRRLKARLDLPVVWQGALCWEEAGAAFDAQRDRLLALGYTLREINGDEFRALEPHIATPPARALLFKQEAAADSPALRDALLARAFEYGARQLRGVTVQGFVETGGRITGIRTEAGNSHADHVVIAAGTGSAGLMAEAGALLPMVRRPALVLRTRPVPPLLRHILVSEFGELRQLGDGTLLMPAAVNHQGDTTEHLTETLQQTADQVMQRLQAMLPGAALDWQDLTLAYRPVPRDGLPVIGVVRDGLSVASMHSGITLAAVTGEMVAQEVLNGGTSETGALLAPFRPERFTE